MEPQRCLFNEVWKGYFVVKVQWAGCSIAFHVLNVMFQYLNMCILFITGWWFGTCFIFPYIGNVIIPTDIFFRGVGIPPTCHNIVLSCLGLYPHSCHLPGAWWRPGRRHSRFSRRHRRDFGPHRRSARRARAASRCWINPPVRQGFCGLSPPRNGTVMASMAITFGQIYVYIYISKYNQLTPRPGFSVYWLMNVGNIMP